MKNVVVVIQKLPFNTIRNQEALRCAVGLTLEEENKIKVVFINDGVFTLYSLDSKLAHSYNLPKHIETIIMMGGELIAEEEALASRDIKLNKEMINILPRERINQAIKEADVVMVF